MADVFKRHISQDVTGDGEKHFVLCGLQVVQSPLFCCWEERLPGSGEIQMKRLVQVEKGRRRFIQTRPLS